MAELRSVSRGAALNGISQSAASQQLQDLEGRCGVTLLDRSRRPLTLTEAGTAYLDFCHEVLAREEALTETLARMRRAVVGDVSVACIYSVGLSEMATLKEQFAERYPDARLAVEYLRPEKVYEAVEGGRADLGLVSYPHATRGLTVIEWRQEVMVVAVAPSHPLARESAIHPSRLEGLPFVGFDRDLPIQRHIEKYLREMKVNVQMTLHFDNIEMIKQAVSLGTGVSIVPKPILRSEIARGTIVALSLVPRGPRRPLGIVHRKRKKFGDAVQAFLTLLLENRRQS